MVVGIAAVFQLRIVPANAVGVRVSLAWENEGDDETRHVLEDLPDDLTAFGGGDPLDTGLVCEVGVDPALGEGFTVGVCEGGAEGVNCPGL
jgi:hypothetical protein